MNQEEENVNINNSEDLAAYINLVINDISKVKDDIQKEIMLNKLSKKYDISLEILKNKLDTIKQEEKIANNIFKDKKQISKLNGLDIAIRKILYYMMCDKKYIRLKEEI